MTKSAKFLVHVTYDPTRMVDVPPAERAEVIILEEILSNLDSVPYTKEVTVAIVAEDPEEEEEDD